MRKEACSLSLPHQWDQRCMKFTQPAKMRGMDGWDTYDKLWRGECVSLCNNHSFLVFKDKEKYVLLKMHKWKYILLMIMCQHIIPHKERLSNLLVYVIVVLRKKRRRIDVLRQRRPDVQQKRECRGSQSSKVKGKNVCENLFCHHHLIYSKI